MDSTQTPTENSDKLNDEKHNENETTIAQIEAMVTPEQEFSASVARKRRTITRKRSESLTSKNRSQTPMRQDALAAAEKSTSEDDESTNSLRPKTPERKNKKAGKTVSSKAITNETNLENNTEISENVNDTNSLPKQNVNNPAKDNKSNETIQNKIETNNMIENEIKIEEENITKNEYKNEKPNKTEADNISRILKHKSDSTSNSERTSVIVDRSSSLPRQFEEQLIKIDNFVNANTQELKQFIQKAKTTVEEKGKELRRRKFKKSEEKRSQSTPKQLTEADLIESFRRAQIATAEREKERIRSNSARRYSSGSEKSLTPERPARKPCKPVVQESLKQKKAPKQLKNKIKSNKIIEILDPKTSKVIAVKDIGDVSRMSFFDVFKILKYYSIIEIFKEYRKYKKDMNHEYNKIKQCRRKCINHLILLMIFCGFGGIIFKFTEGAFENFYKCGVKRVKRDFIDNLWSRSHNLREEEWKSLARNKLRIFEEELHTAHEAGIHSYSGQKSWSFLNGIVYCLTIITTIGYGHIYPTTTTGQALTLVYALIGIPLFLIILTDFGKLFTRCIKFLWSFVRRLYYTGNCRSVRKTAQVQEIFKGAQMMYEIATFRRPSMFDPNMNANQSPSNESNEGTTAPPTPAISNFEIDDEFNLPISLAILLLVLYIFLGAVLFCFWEGWDFFGSFYFVFISMSTIGFGDYVPRHPIFMIISIVYLVFGLALMSMCINVVQVKLSDTFNQASAKIGATIGLGVADDGSIKTVPPRPIEMPEVHGSVLSINKNASTSKS